MSRPSSRRGDRGAFLLIFALCLTVLVILVAFAVDLGQARFSKRSEQQLADLASISAGREMAGYGVKSGGVVVSRPRDACVAGIRSIRTNADGFQPTDAQITAACAALPVTIAGCDASTTPVNATVLDEPYAVTVRWPIPTAELADDRFLNGAGIDDGTDAERCQRLRVAVQRTDDAAFAGIIGVGDLTTTASSVIRANLGNNVRIVPAFLILERTECDALSNSSNGVDSFGVQILGIVSTDQPGTIHVDTTASNGCNGNAANSVAVYGKPLSSGGPSIYLHPAPIRGTSGQLFVVATTNPAKEVPGGVNVTPEPADVVSRAPLDEEFNSTTNPAVPQLHSRARTALATQITDTTTGDNWKRLDCDLNALDAGDLDTENWYVRCDEYSPDPGHIAAAAVLHGGTPNRIVFDGDVNVPNGSILSFVTAGADEVEEVTVKGKLAAAGAVQFGPNIRRIYVGAEKYAFGKNAGAVNISGSMQIRSNLLPTVVSGKVTPVCLQGATGSTDSAAELVIFGDDVPNFSASGTMAMCNTTVYLAGDTLSSGFARQIVDSGGNCSFDLPCPRTSSNVALAGRFAFAGTVDWTAPNSTSTSIPSPRGLEDLLFWSEASGVSDVKSGANVITQGIMAAPNMEVQFRSPAVGEPRNAQFIARKLKLLQGTLQMLPNPNDSTDIPAPGSFTIIR